MAKSHGYTFFKLHIILLMFSFQEEVSYEELKVSKTYIQRLLPPGASGVFTLYSNNVRSYQSANEELTGNTLLSGVMQLKLRPKRVDYLLWGQVSCRVPYQLPVI